MKNKLQLLLLLVAGSVFGQTPILNPSNKITPHGVVYAPQGEEINKIIDGNINSKFLDYVFTDGMGMDIYTGVNSIASQIEFTTANDAPGRDPQNYTIYGSNDGQGFTSITTGTIPCITTRQFTRTISFSNSNSYSHYRIVFTNLCGPENSLQVSEIQILGTISEVFPPLVDEIQEVCPNTTIADLTIIGNDITWYDAPSGGNVLDVSTVLIDGASYYVTQTVNETESPRIQIDFIVSESITNNYEITSCQDYYWDLTGQIYPQSGTYTFINNCKTEILNLTITGDLWYFDYDNDGFGDDNDTLHLCEQVLGYVAVGGDCNSENDAINPSATEICGDGIDNNCNNQVDENCNLGLTSIQSAQCGAVLPKINTYIYANLVRYAQAYRFKVTDVESGEVQTIDRALRVFQITQLPHYRFDNTYQVEVDVKLNGTWQNNYGQACEINTPAVTTRLIDNLCNATLSSNRDYLYANLVPFASGYKFSVTDTTTEIQYVFERPIRSLQLSQIPELSYGKIYVVEVAVINTDGTPMPYGPLCFVQYSNQPENTTKLNTNESGFKVVSYPNPFNSNFTIEVAPTNNEPIRIKVYDIIGKLIEAKEYNSKETTTLNFGENYPSGVYIVTVTEAENTQKIKMIKR